MKKILSMGLVMFLAFFNQLTLAQTPSVPNNGEIYLNPELGKDTNLGTKENPLKSLGEAAKRVNGSGGEGAITIYLSAGVYGMSETADFNAQKWKFSSSNRLTVRAEILPDDEKWSPAEMPILISILPFSVEKNDKGEIIGAQNFGILVQNSHVTIQGLRILGQPVHENPSNGVLIRNYPIVWEGKELEDFRVTQCLFVGSKYTVPNHLGILANGKTLEVDHCVFHGVKDAVVMWNSPATNSSFHHNLIVDSYGGAVWTWSTTSDFKFYNNAISNSNVLWVLEKEEKESFVIENSIIVGYNSLVNKGGGAQGFGEKGNLEKLKFNPDVILKNVGQLEIIEDQTNRNFLHIKPGTLGSNLGAGLFTKEFK
jgi:hypothetical protein